ncbi:MAG TPA: protoporphyrinogen oxidase [Candidatus Elarobacter sp.]|nr:protoporphyrinogen oxidase [Candidatus Elarobacter sp.]
MSAIAVVGAGIAGLAAAVRLAAHHDVTVFEREPSAGGKIRSQHVDGFLFEWGPNGFLSSAAELWALVHEVGLGDELTQAAPAAAKRFVYWNGKLHELPSKPPRMLSMSLLSARGKLRALGDVFARVPPPGETADESVYAFAARHFGREVAQRIVAPALLGISGGDAATTSVDALFPRLRELERANGSVLRGMMRARAKPGRLSGFGTGGMQRLTDRLAQMLGQRLRLGCAVERIEPRAAGWRVRHAGGELDADAVVLTPPADVAAAIVEPCDAELAERLRAIPYAPMRAVGIAFRAKDVPVPLDGFGFLAARGQGLRILGALYTSSIFPAQAPAGSAYLRVFLGGATDPEAVGLEPDHARAIVRADLANALGITAQPIAYHEVTWARAIPQYTLEHRALLSRIDRRVAQHRGLALAGNAYRGLGVGDTVRDALAVAGRMT